MNKKYRIILTRALLWALWLSPVAVYATVNEPYLQAPTSTAITISWHDSQTIKSSVEYGTTDALGSTQQATEDPVTIATVTVWHAVRLTGLTPNTVYSYKCITGSQKSQIFHFKTFPADDANSGKFRVAIYGDNRTNSTAHTYVAKQMRTKLLERAGTTELHNAVDLILNVGDIVTSGGSGYIPQYFSPISSLSHAVPFMVSIGNHEGENPKFYKYMANEAYDDGDDYNETPDDARKEKYYSFRAGPIFFIVMNSNSNFRDTTQTDWVRGQLELAEANDSIKWVVTFCHHPGHSEVWKAGNTAYVQDILIPLLAGYSKVCGLYYGHSHNYEIGAHPESSMRLVLSGAAGGPLDRWGKYPNQPDYPEIYKSYDQFGYTILEFDLADNSYIADTYLLGHKGDRSISTYGGIETEKNELIDHFEQKIGTAAPIKPTTVQAGQWPVKLVASAYSSQDDVEIMSSQFQIVPVAATDFKTPTVDSKRDWTNVYFDSGAPNFDPIDQNAGINLEELVVENGLTVGESYKWRVRYRDQSLRWSDWSEPSTEFTVLSTANANGYKFTVTENVTLDSIAPGGAGWTDGDTDLADNTSYNIYKNKDDQKKYFEIKLGFNFRYCGKTFTHVDARTDGYIALTNGSYTKPGRDYPGKIDNPAWKNALALLWTDQQLSCAVKRTGTPGNYVMTIEMYDIRWKFKTAKTNRKAQLKLYEATGVIEMIYDIQDDIEGGPITTHIGITDNGNSYLSVNPITKTASYTAAHDVTSHVGLGEGNSTGDDVMFKFDPIWPGPLKPTNVQLVLKKVKAIEKATWDITAIGAPITGFKWQLASSKDFTNIVESGFWEDPTATSVNFDQTKQKAGTEYFFRVQSYTTHSVINVNHDWIEADSSAKTFSEPAYGALALWDNGADDVLNCGQITELQNTSAATVELWYKHGGLTNTNQDWNNDPESVWSNGVFGLHYDGAKANNNKDKIFVRVGAATASFKNPDPVKGPTTSHHVAVVFDGSGAENGDRLKVYVNGSLQTLTFTGTVPATIPSTTSPFKLGGANFEGILDEFRVWNIARTATSIDTYKNKIILNPAKTRNLVCYYNFDQVSGTNVPDLSYNGMQSATDYSAKLEGSTGNRSGTEQSWHDSNNAGKGGKIISGAETLDDGNVITNN